MATAADRKRREERVKLGSSAASNLGVAFVVGGAVGPALLGRAQPVLVVIATLIGLTFHLAAQALLHYVAADEPEDG